MADKRKQFEGEIGGMPGQDISVEGAAQRIFNLRADEDYDARVVAMATSIYEIWADVKQPRRAVPASIRLHWNGNPEDVAELLNQWHIIAGKTASIDVYAILQGNGEGIQVEDAPAIFTGYLELLRLAASIRKDGLINPISIVEFGGRNLIETGERRWLAYHVLQQYMGEEWAKIPAKKSDGKNYVWVQAAENTARRALNAIGMARQLALLIMETRRGIEGQDYNDFDELVVNGGCDRRFYAQVANGNVHRVPRGLGERIQGAMNLSEKRIADYRALLKLTEDEVVNDALWIRADVEDWAEMGIRNIISTLPIGKVREIVTRESWALADLREAMEAARNGVVVMPIPSQPSPLAPLPQGEGNQTPTPPAQRVEFGILDKVKTPAGHIGTVIRISGRMIDVQTVNGQKQYYAEHLTLVSRAKEEGETHPQHLPTSQARGDTEKALGAGGQENTRVPVQRINLDDYSQVQNLGGWLMQYRALKRLRDVNELLFAQCAYGHVALWGDADVSQELVLHLGDKFHFETTDHGLTFFAKDYAVIEELSKFRQIATFKSYTDQASINTLWVKTMDKLRAASPTKETDEEFERPVRTLTPDPSPSERGETEEVDSDKADSVIPENGHYYIILHGGPEWQFLNAMREAAKLLEDHDTEKVMTELIGFTTTEVRRWNDRGGIRTLLDGYSDHMLQVLADWQETRLQNVLHQIEQGGRDG